MSLHEINDARLIRNIRRGNTDHFATLIARYLPAVEAVARAHVGNPSDAEDVAQDTFIAALQQLNTLREPAKFSHWLLRIARNKACDWLTGETRERERRAAAGEQLYTGRDESDSAESQELHALLHREIESLASEHREALALFYFAGHGSREIATMLGVSHGAVRKRLQRGRELLGERMLRRMGETVPDAQDTATRARAIYGLAAAAPIPWTANVAGGTVAGVGAFLTGGKFAGAMLALVAVGIAVGVWQDGMGVDNSVAAVQSRDINPPDQPAVETEKGDDAAAEMEAAAAALSVPPPPLGHGIIFGTVYGPNDAPEAGSTVELTLRTREDGVLAYVTFPERECDSEGNFRFEKLPAEGSWYHLRAYSRDKTQAAEANAVLDNDFPWSQRFLELDAAHPYSGHVTDLAGNPIPDARIYPAIFGVPGSGRLSSKSSISPVFSDASGAFRFDHLEAGDWRVEVSAPGYGPELVSLEEKIPVAATLKPGLSFAGTLRERDSGAPVASARVSVRGGMGLTNRYAETNPEGRFQFKDLSAGKWQLGTELGWYADPVLVELADGQDTADIVLEADAGSAIEGRVVLADGVTGVPGVEITVALAGIDRIEVTDESGHFSFDHLPSGKKFALYPSDTPGESIIDMTLDPGEVRRDITIKTQPGTRSVSGRAVDGAGAPLAGVRVEAFGQINNVTPKTMTTGADGAFQFTGIRPEEFFWIRGRREGWISRDVSRSIDKSDLHDLVLTMERPAGLSGRIVGERGEAVAQASVYAQGRDISQYTTRNTTSSEGGRFAFPYLVPGTYTVFGGMEHGPKEALGEVAVAAGEGKNGLIFALPEVPTEEIAGRVLGADGKPLFPVRIEIRGAHNRESYGSTQVDEKGAFRFTGLKAGYYTLYPFKDGYAHHEETDVATGTTDLTVTLQQGAQVTGTVRYANGGAPVEKYVIRAVEGERNEFTESDLLGATTINDPEGRFKLANVKAGITTLVVFWGGDAPAWTTLELAGGETREDVAIFIEDAPPHPSRPRPVTDIRGLVITPNKDPVGGAYIYIDEIPHPSDRSGKARATTGPDGRFEIRDVPLDAGRLFAWHDSHAPAGIELALTGKAVNETTLVMKPGGALHGTLKGSDGPLANVSMALNTTLLGTHAYWLAETDGGGTYRFDHVPEGETDIYLYYKERRYSFPVRVSGGEGQPTPFQIRTGASAIEGIIYLDGAPAQGHLEVTLPRDDGGEERFLFDSTRGGHFYIDALPAGALSLAVTCDGGGRVTHSVTTLPESVTSVEISVISEGDSPPIP